MKNKFVLIGTTLFCLVGLLGNTCLAGYAYKVDIKKTFGAKGDGKTDDTQAFVNAADYINAKHGNCQLTIPSGKYRVGKQYQRISGKNIPLSAKPILALKNCENFSIIGIGVRPTLQYNDNLYYGSFDQNLKPLKESEIIRPLSDYNKTADLSFCISLNACKKGNISNIILNGNMVEGKMKIGGGYGDLDCQLQHYGLSIVNSTEITIDKMRITRFALDGGIIWNGQSYNTSNANVSILNSEFSYNGRQAFTVSSGINLFFKNCSFQNSGRGLNRSAPGAGVDIEPENLYGNAYVENCNFDNCQFYNNVGPGLLTVSSEKAKKITFNNSLFIGNTFFSVWVLQKQMVFNDCKFLGSTVHNFGDKDTISKNSTRYNRCIFSDNYENAGISPGIYPSELYFYNGFLVNSTVTDNVIYNTCNFFTKNHGVMWLKTNDYNLHYYLINCKIKTKYKSSDGVWVPNIYSINSEFQIPAKTLHLGLNYPSAKSVLNPSSKVIETNE